MRQQATATKFFRPHTIHPLWAVIIGTVALLIIGCPGPSVGEACDDDTDCGNDALICDASVEGGFCTIRDCRPGDCPAESICVQFGNYDSYCMRTCNTSAECREDHNCIDDRRAEARYCFVTD